MSNIDSKEIKKIRTNKKLFKKYNTDHFEIDTVLEILSVGTLPIDVPMNNNQIFIRDLSNYMVDKGIKV